MAINYFDSSALIKRYIPERGSAWVTNAVASSAVATSMLTLVEVASTFGRLTRAGTLTAEQRDELHSLFVQDSMAYQVVDVSPALARAAAALLLSDTEFVRLRTLDALQLASARAVLDETDPNLDPGAFICADRALLAAARQVGLAAQNPEDYE